MEINLTKAEQRELAEQTRRDSAVFMSFDDWDGRFKESEGTALSPVGSLFNTRRKSSEKCAWSALILLTNQAWKRF